MEPTGQRHAAPANAVPRRRAATGAAGAVAGRCGRELSWGISIPADGTTWPPWPYNATLQPATSADAGCHTRRHLKSVHRCRQRLHLSLCRARMKPCGGRGGGTVPRVASLPPPSCSLLQQRHLAGSTEQPHGGCNGPLIATSRSGCKAVKSEFDVNMGFPEY